MLRSSEQKIDGKIGIFGRFAVQYTMPDMFVWLEQRSDSITSNFAVREYWTHELAGTRESKANRCSGVNDRVGQSVLDPKSHGDSNSGIHLLLRWADFALFAEPEPISSLFAAI